jgi:hypothetical protein
MFEARSQAQEEAKASMLMAQEHAKWYFDQNHRTVPFKVGDKVWIKGKDIKIHLKKPLSDKLAAQKHGPFEITDQYGEATFRVKLTKKYESRHPVFHAQKLIMHQEDTIGDRNPSEPGPLDFDDQDEPIYEIDRIVDSKIVGGDDDDSPQKVMFQVRWLGWTDEEDRWLDLFELKDAKDAVRDYIRKNPDAPLPRSLTDSRPRVRRQRRTRN